LSFPEKYACDNLVSTEQSPPSRCHSGWAKNVSSPLVPGMEALIVRAAGQGTFPPASQNQNN
jgi:hypothetical protein